MEYQYARRMDCLPFSGIRSMMEHANKMQQEGTDIIHMEIGRPDFDTPEVIKKAAYASIETGNVFYTSNYGIPELRTAIAHKLTTENDVKYDPEEILVTVGVGEGTYAAIAAFCDPGDEILVPDPVWLNYINVPNFFGAVPVAYSLKEANAYQIDPAQIEALISEKTRMIIINSPGNPTGAVQSRQTLEKVAAIAQKHDLIVVSDEIYEKLVYDDTKHVSIASLPGMKERTITLNGFSKCYSMTGWRLGYAAAPSEMISALVRVHQYINTCAPSFVQEAGITALRDAESDVRIMVKEYEKRRNYAVKQLNSMDKVSCLIPEGAFYIFLNVSKLGMTSSQMSEYLLDHAHVATVPGTAFGKGGEGYIRLSYATAYDEIETAMQRMRRVFTHLNNRQ